MNRVDLRSDTVTQPTPGMKELCSQQHWAMMF